MIFGRRDKPEEDDINSDLKVDTNRIIGKIYHIEEDKGWGFISSDEIKFTRIFFHWQGLAGDTKNFKDLELGDKVEFTPVEVYDEETKQTKWRAIRVRVVD